MTQIYVASTQIEADIIASLLRSQGIEVFLRSDNTGGVDPSLTLIHGIAIFVKEEEAQAALALIEDSTQNR